MLAGNHVMMHPSSNYNLVECNFHAVNSAPHDRSIAGEFNGAHQDRPTPHRRNGLICCSTAATLAQTLLAAMRSSHPCSRNAHLRKEHWDNSLRCAPGDRPATLPATMNLLERARVTYAT